MIHKSFSAETKVLDSAHGLVDCVFSVTGVKDRQGDIIEPGAFTKALAAKSSVPVVYAHVWNDINAVLGKTVGWRELSPYDSALPPNLQSKGYGGVRATVQFDQETPSGRLAFQHVKSGNIKDWSFAFDSNKALEKFDSDGTRRIREIPEIFEVTLALIGANQEAMTLAVKKTMEMQHGSRAADAEEWAFINRYIAKRAADGEAQPTKTISTNLTHVEKWIDDQSDRANLPMTYGDRDELMACLEQDNPSAARYLYEYFAQANHAMTPNGFKRFADSVAERN